MSLCIDDEKLLEKYKTIWTKIEDLKKIIEMLYIEHGGKVYTTFSCLNVPEDDTEC